MKLEGRYEFGMDFCKEIKGNDKEFFTLDITVFVTTQDETGASTTVRRFAREVIPHVS